MMATLTALVFIAMMLAIGFAALCYGLRELSCLKEQRRIRQWARQQRRGAGIGRHDAPEHQGSALPGVELQRDPKHGWFVHRGENAVPIRDGIFGAPLGPWGGDAA